MSIQTIILAAGEGKRMQSDTPKVLHKICSEEVLMHVLRAVEPLGKEKPIIVIGHCGEKIKDCLNDRFHYVWQKEQLGTGHAVQCAMDQIVDQEGYILVVAGDMPLLRTETLQHLIYETRKNDWSCTVLTATVADPSGYGRIIRKPDGTISSIVEHKEATEEQLLIQETNSSVYCFKNSALKDVLYKLDNQNTQNEFYLTDCISLLSKTRTVGSVSAEAEECQGVNDRVQLSEAAKIMRRRINQALMLKGVQIIDPEQCYIDARAKIARDVIIYPGNVIEGAANIGSGTVLFPGNFLEEGVQIGEKCKIGPNAHLRKGTVLGNACRVGNFVELKNLTLDDGAKVSHLAYCGDGHVGKKSNISCGVIFSNYDGVNKNYTVVGDNAFVGCNVNLVAPVTVGDGAYIAAGSTVTQDVPPDALAIAREKQTNKPDWAAVRREKLKNKN